MTLPQVGSTYFQERAGVIRVTGILNTMRLIWRETPNADVGIDGQVELVDDSGGATGATIAAQIKSGASYFRDGGDFWKYQPSVKHRIYWEIYPLPVVLFMHKPDDDVVYWVDTRRQLRGDEQREPYIAVPKAQTLSAISRDALFESCGSPGVGLATPDLVLRHLALTQSKSAAFPISHLDIFLEGLTDIGRKLFFSAGMCWDLAGARVDDGVSMGEPEQKFLDDFVRYLVSQSLAFVDYSDFLIDLHDKQLISTFLVPLTSRGRAVRDLCREIGSSGSPGGITEASVGLIDGNSLPLRRCTNQKIAEQVVKNFAG
jgi:hypothetical protein